MTITWALKADFDKSGTYETALTTYVARPGGGLKFKRGIGATGSYAVSMASIGLNNASGSLTPENSASPFYGQLVPDVPLQIVATHNAIDYTRWTGYSRRWNTSWRAGGVALCALDAQDIAAYLGHYSPVNVTIGERTTNAALNAIVTAIGLDPALTSFATGAQTLPIHWVTNQDALTAMMDVVKSELGGRLFVNAAGVIVFEARTTRLGIGTPDDTWGDGTNIVPRSVQYDIADDDLVTSVSVQSQRVTDTDPLSEVFAFSLNADGGKTPDSIRLLAGETYGPVTLSYATPVASLTAPVASTDYAFNSAIGGTGTDLTGNLTVTVTNQGGNFLLSLKNIGGTTGYVTKFRLRGVPVVKGQDRPVYTTTKAITGNVIDHGITLGVPFVGDESLPSILQHYSHALLRTYRIPYPRLVLGFRPNHADAIVALLSVEIGDLIKYVDTGLGASQTDGVVSSAMVDDWWYVESVEHVIPPNWAGATFDATVVLVPSYIYRNLDRLVYDLFTAANAVGDLGTSTSGDVWANDGNMDIATNAARANSDTLQMPNLDLGAGATDQVVEVSLAAIGAGDEVGVVFRYVDANNQYRAYLDKGSNEVICEKNVATVVTELASPAFTVGTAHELRVLMQGSRIRVYVDNVKRIDVTDTALTTGTKVGLFARNANATTTFDDVYAEGL